MHGILTQSSVQLHDAYDVQHCQCYKQAVVFTLQANHCICWNQQARLSVNIVTLMFVACCPASPEQVEQAAIAGGSTILVLQRLDGAEEVPVGVVGVVVLGQCPDVLSHAAVRARNCRIPVVAVSRCVQCDRTAGGDAQGLMHQQSRLAAASILIWL
jgi:hypothetical protein